MSISSKLGLKIHELGMAHWLLQGFYRTSMETVLWNMEHYAEIRNLRE